jgi:hypothetical protein
MKIKNFGDFVTGIKGMLSKSEDKKPKVIVIKEGDEKKKWPTSLVSNYRYMMLKHLPDPQVRSGWVSRCSEWDSKKGFLTSRREIFTYPLMSDGQQFVLLEVPDKGAAIARDSNVDMRTDPTFKSGWIGVKLDRDLRPIALAEFNKKHMRGAWRVGPEELIRLIDQITLVALSSILDQLEVSSLEKWPADQLVKLLEMAGPEESVAKVKTSLEKGSTPTRLMSALRRAWPDQFEREFGKDDISADMGDIGF